MASWTKTLFYTIYLATVMGMLFPTVMTLLPWEADKQNYLGYVSKCSFAPWSTLSLVGITVLLIGIVKIIQLATGN